VLGPEEQRDIGLRLRDGDRTAWAALFEHYRIAVWRLSARLVGNNPTDVADVVQEVFLAAAPVARRFDPDRGTLWSWLTGITHRQAANFWRKEERASRWKSLAESGQLDVLHLFESDDHFLIETERQEVADLVRRVLAELPSDYAVLLTSKYLDDRSLEDLAAEFGSTIEATKSKLARARREFRAAFELLVGSDQGARLS
jgi:RNA polymerase sigma-70 factor (ECF subfamily)